MRFPEVFARKRGEIPSLTLAFLGLRFRWLTFNRPTPSQASQAIHPTTIYRAIDLAHFYFVKRPRFPSVRQKHQIWL
jgi:hypothetical protein